MRPWRQCTGYGRTASTTTSGLTSSARCDPYSVCMVSAHNAYFHADLTDTLFAQVVLHTQDPEYASYFLFYKWGEPPPHPQPHSPCVCFGRYMSESWSLPDVARRRPCIAQKKISLRSPILLLMKSTALQNLAGKTPTALNAVLKCLALPMWQGGCRRWSCTRRYTARARRTSPS